MRCVLVRWPLVVGLLAVLAAGMFFGAYEVTKRIVAEVKAPAPKAVEVVTPAVPSPGPQVEEKVLKPEADSFFVDYRLEREAKRSRELELLREIAAREETSATTRQEAQEKLMALARQAERETRTENILRAKGFEDALVVIEEQGVTVVIPGKLNAEENATIVNIVYHSLGLPQEQVMILRRD
ncbi:MAG: SpoIIIAH-like family protein [Bacillota bacterium]|nr:SpoIIIAH-like family protein [Thermoanaerobacteraceae bacterium]